MLTSAKFPFVSRRWGPIGPLESLKGKRCCRQIKFYCGVRLLTLRWFCLSRILSEAAEPRCSTPSAIKLPDALAGLRRRLARAYETYVEPVNRRLERAIN